LKIQKYRQSKPKLILRQRVILYLYCAKKKENTTMPPKQVQINFDIKSKLVILLCKNIWNLKKNLEQPIILLFSF
jgi:hypothetical protein